MSFPYLSVKQEISRVTDNKLSLHHNTRVHVHCVAYQIEIGLSFEGIHFNATNYRLQIAYSDNDGDK